MAFRPSPIPHHSPAAAVAEMLRSGVSVSARLSVLFACLAIIAALQFPLLISYYRRLHDTPRPVSEDFNRSKALAALAGLSQYWEKASAVLHKKRREYSRLESSQKLLLATSVKYVPKISHVSKAAETNDILAKAIRDFGLAYYNISTLELRAYERTHRNVGDQTQVVQALKHFVRDWSRDGKHERDAAFPQILETVKMMFPEDTRNRMRVLVPGAGLGRLSYELSVLGFDVVANEFSMYMALAHRYILSQHTGNPNAQVNGQTFYPNINWWSHHRNQSSLIRAVSLPDILPEAKALKRLKLVEGDFVTTFLPHEEGKFDVVATLFFIDTARNIVDYLQTISKVLKPGGIWVNFGPLLYGTAPLIELSLDEVLKVTEMLGFELMPVEERWGEDTFPDVEDWRGKVRGKMAGYSWDQESLSRNAYQAQFWVARKKYS